MSVYKHGKMWYVKVYTKQGECIRRAVDTSKSLAKQAEVELKHRIAKEAFLGIVDPKKILFKDFATEFVKWAEVNRAKETTKKYNSVINKWLLPLWGNMYPTADYYQDD